MKVLKLLANIGLSHHDTLLLFSLLETCWWFMYSFNDGGDSLLRMEMPQRAQVHPFMQIQKGVSCAKLCLAFGLLMYGTLAKGKSLSLRLFVLIGVFMDVIFIFTWLFVAIEEQWPMVPSNIFGLHYVVIFILFRSGIYFMFTILSKEIFTETFGQQPVIGTVNGNIIGLPERNAVTLNVSNTLGMFGKGFMAIVDHYRREPEKMFLICVTFDMIWTLAIVISQELPEVLFDVIFVGPLASLTLDVPTENLGLRLLRVSLDLIAIYFINKKMLLYTQIWIGCYFIVMTVNIVFFCYLASSTYVEETTLAIFILCTIFFASNFVKIFVIWSGLRYCIYLNKENVTLINENAVTVNSNS